MILKCFFTLMTTVHIHGFHGPTSRSSIMEANKPILRMPLENSAEQIDNSPQEALKSEPIWREELRSSIKRLVEKLGHRKAKPHIQKLVEETENINDVLLHVKVSRDGVSNIKYKHTMRAAWIRPGQTWTHPTMTPEPDPQWLADLKVFIKELIGRYGKRRLDEFVTPVIKAIQKQHEVLIKDIDVDHYGEVYIVYVKRSPYRSSWTKKKVKKTKKQRKSSEDSIDSDSEVSRRVTEIPMEDEE